ncbi:MAG: DUF1080 domain-containing protein [Planctomycetaceae bacterium]
MTSRFLGRWICLLACLSWWGGSGVAAQESPVSRPTPNKLTPAEVEEGWISLFDGETLFGWKANNRETNWRVHAGVIEADAGPAGLLCTTSEFADYELRCEFRLASGGNSGIFLRTLLDPKEVTRDCYELNMCDSHPAFPTGSLVGLVKPETPVSGEGRWLEYRVKCQGRTIEVLLAGRLVLKYTDDRPQARFRGLIGLQKNAGKAEYRNVFLRPLATEPLFNGKNLDGWRVVPGGSSRFTVAEGAIHVENGRGFLETQGTWGDFVLQAQARTNGAGLTSGLFFRSMPGTAEEPSNGYELQIHNAFKNKDRGQPADFGTGGIYRRVPARRVVGDDGVWQTLTLVATGPHMGAWVNGELVTDWIDERKPNDNPRQGLRTRAGHLSLQGHDPTTNLDFRNLRIAELPAATVADQ